MPAAKATMLQIPALTLSHGSGASPCAMALFVECLTTLCGSWDAWEEAITHLDSLKGGASEAWNKLQHAAVVVSLETRGSVPQTRGKGLLSQHAHSILCGSNQSCQVSDFEESWTAKLRSGCSFLSNAGTGQGGGWIKNLPFILVVLADGTGQPTLTLHAGDDIDVEVSQRWRG
eukprot:3931772-Rhodomonas_salina.2